METPTQARYHYGPAPPAVPPHIRDAFLARSGHNDDHHHRPWPRGVYWTLCPATGEIVILDYDLVRRETTTNADAKKRHDRQGRHRPYARLQQRPVRPDIERHRYRDPRHGPSSAPPYGYLCLLAHRELYAMEEDHHRNALMDAWADGWVSMVEDLRVRLTSVSRPAPRTEPIGEMETDATGDPDTVEALLLSTMLPTDPIPESGEQTDGNETEEGATEEEEEDLAALLDLSPVMVDDDDPAVEATEMENDRENAFDL